MPPTNNSFSRRFEVFTGRSLAVCAHPFAAWRSRSGHDRAALLFAYFAIGYLLVFVLLRLTSA